MQILITCFTRNPIKIISMQIMFCVTYLLRWTHFKTFLKCYLLHEAFTDFINHQWLTFPCSMLLLLFFPLLWIILVFFWYLLGLFELISSSFLLPCLLLEKETMCLCVYNIICAYFSVLYSIVRINRWINMPETNHKNLAWFFCLKWVTSFSSSLYMLAFFFFF